MKIKTFNFKIRVLEIDNEKYNADIEVKAVSLPLALEELWSNKLHKQIDIRTAASISIINLSEFMRI